VEIRSASEHDIDRLLPLHVELHEWSAAGLPSRLRVAATYDVDAQRAYMRELIAGSSVCLVAFDDASEPIGLAEVRLRDAEIDPGVVPVRRGYLQALVVTREHRDKGVGRTLLQAAEAWARSNGAEEMELDHWLFDGGPGAFYDRAGYGVLSVMRVKRLDP
jgi:GNAT superfamily N-acetyltransferase